MQDKRSSSTTDLIILISLCLLAVSTRFYDFANWHLVADEYFTVDDANFKAVADRFKSFINPAYYFFAAVSVRLFGDTELALRLPAFVFGSLSVPVFFLTWRKIIGRNAAFFSSFLVVLSSWHLWYSQQARFYSGVFLFGLLSYYFLYRSIREDKLLLLAIGLAASLIAILFHLTTVFIPASFGIYCLHSLIARSGRENNSARIARLFLSVLALVALIGLPFLLGIAASWSGSNQSWGYEPILFALQTVKYLQIPIVVAAFCGFMTIIFIDRWQALFFLYTVGLPVVAMMILSGVVAVRPDYLFYTLAPICALAGILCEELRLGAQKCWLGFAGALLVSALLLPEFISHYSARMSLDVKDAIAFVEKNYGEGDRVISFVGGFDRYSAKDFQTDEIPGNAYDDSVSWDAFTELYESGPRTWLVLPISRDLPARGLDDWLAQSARLMWRRTAVRFDYTHTGYEIFLVNGAKGQ